MGRVEIPDARRWRTWMIVTAIAVVVGVVVAGVVLVVNLTDQPPCDGQPDLQEINHECIGVTRADSRFVFGHPEFQPVVDRIAEANAGAATDPRHVTVAVFLPMTPAPDGRASVELVKNQLEGASQAQVTFNHDSNPKIQLVIATAGENFEHWSTVVDMLGRLRSDPGRLVAVTGFAVSLVNVEHAMKALSAKRIPMVSSTVTTDSLRGIAGLLRPAPTNTRQAQAAASYAKQVGLTTALIAEDINPQDDYPGTLADAFQKEFNDTTHRVLDQRLKYDSSLGGVDAAFALQLPNICTAPIDLVYFAGRGSALSVLVTQLANRLCLDKPVHIVTGDDNLPTERQSDPAFQRGLAANVDIVYTDLADQRAWAADQARPANQRVFSESAVDRFRGEKGFKEMCLVCAFGESSLVDDDSILSYDAVLTTITAVHLASNFTGERDRVDSTMVLQILPSLNGQNAIPGASGTLSYDNNGEAQDKVVILLRRLPKGEAELVDLQGK